MTGKSTWPALPLSLLLAVFLCGNMFGQTMTVKGELAGVVKDQQGTRIPTIVVKISSKYGEREVLSDTQGNFIFTNLAPGAYDVSAAMDGFEPFTGVDYQVRLGEITFVPVVLKVGKIADTTILVKADVKDQMVEIGTSSVGASIDRSIYTSVPMRRDLWYLFYMAPGVSEGGRSGEMNPSVSGGSGLENTYAVEGVNITNPSYGALGACTSWGTFGSLGTGVNFDFLDAVQVKTGGLEAEYGSSTGGVINIITKSGSNQFAGGIYFYGQPAGWSTARRQEDGSRYQRSGELASSRQFDVAFDLSGYLKKNHLFFFAAFNPEQTINYLAAPAGYGQSAWGEGPYDQQKRFYSWASKLTWNIDKNQNHAVEFSSFSDPSSMGYGPNRNMMIWGTDNYSRVNYASWSTILRYSGVLRNWWYLTGSVARASSRFDEYLSPESDSYQQNATYYSMLDFQQYWNRYYGKNQAGRAPVFAELNGAFLYGGQGFLDNNSNVNWQYNIKNSFFNLKFLGTHDIDLGAAMENIRNEAFRTYTGPSFQIDRPYGRSGQVMGAAVWRNWVVNPSNHTQFWDVNKDGKIDQQDLVYQVYDGIIDNAATSGITRYYSAYVQDTWKISQRVIVKAGVRFENQQLKGEKDSYWFTGNIAPRLSVILDVFGDGRTKISAAWGRFFEKIPVNFAMRVFNNIKRVSGLYSVAQTLDENTFAAQNLQDPPFPVLPFNVRDLGALTVLPGTRSMYQDEIVVSFEHLIRPTLGLKVRFIDRKLGRCLEDLSSLTAGQYQALRQDLQYLFNSYIGNPGSTLDVVNNSTGRGANASIDEPFIPAPDGIADGYGEASRHYRAFEIVLDKRFSNGFQFFANYRWARLWGNYEGVFQNNETVVKDPHVSPMFDLRLDPSNSADPTALMLAEGPLNTDRRHTLNFQGFYTFMRRSAQTSRPMLTLGLGMRLASGVPMSQYRTNLVYPDTNDMPVYTRGQVQDPVSGTVRAMRTPWLCNVDVHADYPLFVRDRYRLRVGLDLFNVLNRKSVTLFDQDYERYGAPSPDFLTAVLFQRPFNAQFFLRFEF